MFGTCSMACTAIEPSRRADQPGHNLIHALIHPLIHGPIAALLGLLAILMVAGCTATPAERDSAAGEIARKGGLARSIVRSQGFVLTTWSRIADAAGPIRVYIEGDG